MKPDSFHLAAGDGDEDFRQGRASSDAAPSAHTPWFPIKTKPVREGVYQVALDAAEQLCTWYAYWNGASFRWHALSVDGAFETQSAAGAGPQTAFWRGLTKARDGDGSPLREGTRPDAKDGAA